MESRLLAVLVFALLFNGIVCKPACKYVNCDLTCGSGLEKDTNGCPICKCKCPERACPPVKCMYGLRLDANNCPTCICNSAPCREISKDKCPLLCEQGYLKDDNNCPICACVPTKCPDIRCEFGSCPAGNKKNSLGCDVCECKPNCSSSECNKLCADKRKYRTKIATCGCSCNN
ncbi:antistasin-like [Physella acuta]|uniref:antistasin-like n=1 Tax=Physella acuta TaxID=109671 RepID=UPI0027DBC713|nr:antistasin-like [Physella acuta]